MLKGITGIRSHVDDMDFIPTVFPDTIPQGIFPYMCFLFGEFITIGIGGIGIGPELFFCIEKYAWISADPCAFSMTDPSMEGWMYQPS